MFEITMKDLSARETFLNDVFLFQQKKKVYESTFTNLYIKT
jgi:hypothetical protein